MSRLALFARALVLLARTRALLARRGTTTALRQLTRRRRTGGEVEPTQALWAIRRAGRVIGGACLPQSVALAALLHRGGVEPALILGCSRTADASSWTAHAWVEIDGAVLEPVKGSRHARLACLDAQNGWVPMAPSG